MNTALNALLAWYETLSPATLDDLGRHYADNVHFKDPFNDVHGLAGVRRVFAHMFASTGTPRFTVLERVADGRQAFVTWDFHCTVRGRPLTLHGASRLCFDAHGRVCLHRDYWDSAEELLHKLPVIGAPLRGLRRLLSAR
ncbi:nuclear transport factor 2 family protein [Jeongeupia chitinilytica]|uniref:SnoaL-like domain-containing protein n=1 Tax=Jeongeupia chitinilytica TaxID=1041641 RepID=A0ABQ3H0G5_9NEIS|nr:nuclear transport factor 2 family protein [Jeongeupia chitinilytica]GHD64267.1 hypothetical protein GCM10007350_23020 [Jeongeupia chitinilytica]